MEKEQKEGMTFRLGETVAYVICNKNAVRRSKGQDHEVSQGLDP